jgi:ABC-2 type transport system permease protein
MTTQAASRIASGKGGGHEGTVFDIGYRNYTGVRESIGRSRMAIFKDGIRIALGFGRGGRAKILPWLFIAILSGIGLIMAMIAGAAQRLVGTEAASQMNLPSHNDYYGIAASLMFVFASIVSPELLCRDRREGTINLYLVRPLAGSDYILARWGAFMVVFLFAALLPQLILFLGLAMGDAVPLQYLKTHWLDVPRFITAGLVMTAFATGLAMLTASFTTRRAYASVFLVGLFLVTTPFTVGLSQEIGGKVGQWMSMFSLLNIPLHVNDVIFGAPGEITEEAPARAFGSAALIGWYFLWTLGPTAILWWRYRRLTP